MIVQILADDPSDGPVFAVISRLTWQKGMDVLLDCLDPLVAMGGRLALVGSGGMRRSRSLSSRRRCGIPGGSAMTSRCRICCKGRADAILIPSRFDPCGLTQLWPGLWLRAGRLRSGARFALFGERDRWRSLQADGIRADFGWASSGARYAALYRRMMTQ